MRVQLNPRILATVVIVGALALIGLLLIPEQKESSDMNIVLPELPYDADHYSHPSTGYVMSKEEFEVFQTTSTVETFKTYDEYVSSVATMESTVHTNDANGKLLQMCEKYFNCYYDSTRISPLLPMAIANVETPLRADNSITWSALFPSKYISADEMTTFNVCDVLRDEKLFNALGKDYSTRDRGSLQMSPAYGSGNNAVNAMMSGSEYDKLKELDSDKHRDWQSGAAKTCGDRFYLPDVLLRSQVAMSSTAYYIQKNDLRPVNEYHLLSMLAVSHNSGPSIWTTSKATTKVGNWYSQNKCLEWCRMMSSTEMIDAIREYTEVSDRPYIDANSTWRIISKVYPNLDYTDYTSSKTNAGYPVKVLYCYLKLSSLYTER